MNEIYMIEDGDLEYINPSDISRLYQSDVFVSDLWNLNIHNYEFDGDIIASVSIDDIKNTSQNDQLAIFVGDECRGYSNAMYCPITQEYVFHLRAYSNSVEERMSFNFFDSKTGTIYEDIQSIEFKSNMILGDAVDTYNLSISFNEMVPIEYQLSDAYPNPFNPSTTLNYHVAENGLVNISVFDISGRLVKEITNGHQSVGQYEVTWTAENQSSGVYFVKFNVNDFTQIKKVLLVK